MQIAETSRYLSQVNIKTHKACLLQQTEPARVTITRERGSLIIKNDLIELDLDNRAFFDSMGLKSISALANDLVIRGRKAALEATARYAQEGDMLADPHVGNAISQIAIQRTQKNMETVLAFIPEEPPKIHWTGGTVDIAFTPDKLQFDFQSQEIRSTYIPYAVNFSVEK